MSENKVKQMDGKIYWSKNAKILKHCFVSRHEFINFFESHFEELPFGFTPYDVNDLYNSKTFISKECFSNCVMCGGKVKFFLVNGKKGRLECQKCFRSWGADDETQGGYKK